jgi:capsid assembly protease
MTNLDLELRTPGRVMLLDRRAAQAFMDRIVVEGLPHHRSGLGIVGRFKALLKGGTRPIAMEDDDAPSEAKAMPVVRWARDVEYGEGYAIVEGVAIIDVEGLLTPDGYIDWWEWCYVPGYSQISAAFAAAREDERINAIFMRVNSPGGFVDGCFDVANEIRAGNAANGGKPVWVHTRMACSAAFALASGADRIIATAEGDVGSIGVLILHVDMTGMLEEWGLKVEAIQSGARKTDGAAWKPLSDDARTHLKGVVDQVAKTFIGVVEAGRGISADDIRTMEARWFLAQHDDPAQSGLALGLVDGIASEKEAFRQLTQSLSGETESGAPAAAGSKAADPAARAATTETDMGLKEQVAALRDKAKKGDAAAAAELKALGISLEAEADEEEDKEAAGADEGDGDEDDADEEEDEDKEPEAKATGSKAAFHLVGSKAARGREDLAKKLGSKVSSGKLSYGEAKSMLEAAPKGSRLSTAMAGRDHNPGADGGESTKPGAGLASAVDRVIEAHNKQKRRA